MIKIEGVAEGVVFEVGGGRVPPRRVAPSHTPDQALALVLQFRELVMAVVMAVMVMVVIVVMARAGLAGGGEGGVADEADVGGVGVGGGGGGDGVVVRRRFGEARDDAEGGAEFLLEGGWGAGLVLVQGLYHFSQFEFEAAFA